MNEIEECLQYAQILDRIRLGEHTEDDIRVLKTRVLKTLDPNDPSYPIHISHLFHANKKVDEFTKIVIQRTRAESLEMHAESDNKIIWMK